MTDSEQVPTGTVKTYVLDTSVLLSTPTAMLTFAEHEVVIPLVVVKELESKRHDPLLGHPARVGLRLLEDIRTRPGASLREGTRVNDEGGTVRIEPNNISTAGLPAGLRDDRSHDTRILAVAHNLKADGRTVVVVSKDLPMRILAETLGLEAQQYRRDQVVTEAPYTGLVEVEVTAEEVAELYESHTLTPSTRIEAPVNTAAVVSGPNSSGLAVLNRVGDLVRLREVSPFGVAGRSVEQKVALTHLSDPTIGVVSLGGKAGTGKTLLALAAGLQGVFEDKTYDRIIVFRPLFAVGEQDLGYLPGTAEDKMGPWAQAVNDALATIGDIASDYVKDSGKLEVLPLTHIRGRSLTRTFVIIDEAQNLERSTLLTALSRTGEGSKVVLAWDAGQRDNLRVGRHDGIAAIVERLKGEPLFAHVTLTRSERGPVAAMVTRLLDDE